MKIRYRQCDCCGQTIEPYKLFTTLPIRKVNWDGSPCKLPWWHYDVCEACMNEIMSAARMMAYKRKGGQA